MRYFIHAKQGWKTTAFIKLLPTGKLKIHMLNGKIRDPMIWTESDVVKYVNSGLWKEVRLKELIFKGMWQ